MALAAALAGSLIGLMIDCIILNIDSSAIITDVWSELRFTIAISLFSFFGTILYFHYDNFNINWQRKKRLQNTIKRI